MQNPDWELVCDVECSKYFYVQWNELSKAERMSWIGSYGSEAHDAFEELATKDCKVETMNLDTDLELCKKWPPGHTMLVFKTKIAGVPAA